MENYDFFIFVIKFSFYPKNICHGCSSNVKTATLSVG